MVIDAGAVFKLKKIQQLLKYQCEISSANFAIFTVLKEPKKHYEICLINVKTTTQDRNDGWNVPSV